MGNYFVYILALEDNKYYVGISKDVYQRYHQHLDQKGAFFTWLNHPKGLICSRQLKTWMKSEAETEEDKMTLLMMEAFGVENVRGGKYCQVRMRDLINAMGDELYSSITESHKYVNLEDLFKPYPEIKYGLDLLKYKVEIPININTYRMWPNNVSYKKDIEKWKHKYEEMRKLVDRFMNLLLDETIPTEWKEAIVEVAMPKFIEAGIEFKLKYNEEGILTEINY